MQASETQDARKAALHTSLKCGIPVVALMGFLLLCFFNPESSFRMACVVYTYLVSGLSVAFFGIVGILRTLNGVVVPSAAIVIGGLLWSGCAINHLKTKGLTGSLYVKLVNVFSVCAYGVFAITFLALCVWLSMLTERPPEESTILLWSGIAGLIPVVYVFLHTLNKNKEIFEGDN
jgi:hypothetical protein